MRFMTVLFLLLATAASYANQQPVDDPATDGQTVFELDFPGGTADDFVRAIRRKVPAANIVSSDDLKLFTVPSAQLKRVDVGSAVALLNDLRAVSGNEAVQIDVDVIQTQPSRVSSPIYQIAVERKPSRSPLLAQTQVWSVADLVRDEHAPEDLLTAIETAIELDQHNEQQTQLRFHRETRLLIARGDPLQLNTIDMVIDQLRKARSIEIPREKMARAHAEYEQQIIEMKQNVDHARGQTQNLKMELHNWQTQAEMMRSEIEKLQQERIALQNQIAAIKLERDTLATRMADQIEKLKHELAQQGERSR